jgi:hypothetical protein
LDQAREIGEWATARGIHFVDGAAECSPPALDSRNCTFYVSGTKANIATANSVLKVLARGAVPCAGVSRPMQPVGTVYNLGDRVGIATAYDAALQAFLNSALIGYRAHRLTGLCFTRTAQVLSRPSCAAVRRAPRR